MKQIPTASEFMYEKDILNPNKKITEAMIEFAKLHVEAAKREFFEVIKQEGLKNVPKGWSEQFPNGSIYDPKVVK